MTRRTSTRIAQQAADKPATLTFAAKSKSPLYDDQAVYEFVSWLTRFPDPDEVLRKAGLTRASLRAIEYDDEIAQCLDTRREALIATPWRLEPQQPRANKWLTEEMTPHMPQLIASAFSAVLYGYSVCEVVYTRRNGKIGISHLSEKPLEWFEPRHDGSLIYYPQVGDQIVCDTRKYILSRNNPSYRQPYGEALLSRLYWTAFFRSHGRKFWAKFLERFGEPLLIGKVRDQQKFVNDLLSLGVGAGLPVGNEDSIDHIAVTQAGEFERFEQAMSKSIQKLILGQTLTSDVGSTGSYAAAKVHDQVRQTKRNADIRMVTQAAQSLIANLCALNGISKAPDFVMADDTGLELERAQRDKLHYEIGMRHTPEYFMDRYDYREGDFELTEDNQLEQDAAMPDKPEPDQQSPEEIDKNEQTDAEMAAHLHTMRPRKVQFTPQQQAIEDAGSAIIAKAPQPIAADAMLSAVKAATDPADLAVRLSLLLDKQDPRFTELLARANFAAQVLGYVVAEKEAPQPAKPKDAAPPNIVQHFHMPDTFGAPAPITVQMAPGPAPSVNVDVHVPEQSAPIVNMAATPAPVVQIDVQPAPVTVNNMHPAQAVQTVERDPETQEIIKTITTYTP